MPVNKKCPKCGSEKVQLSDEGNKHGCLYTILFGFFYIFWVIIKWCIGLMILMFYDWWMELLKNLKTKGMFDNLKDDFQIEEKFITAIIADIILEHNRVGR